MQLKTANFGNNELDDSSLVNIHKLDNLTTLHLFKNNISTLPTELFSESVGLLV